MWRTTNSDPITGKTRTELLLNLWKHRVDCGYTKEGNDFTLDKLAEWIDKPDVYDIEELTEGGGYGWIIEYVPELKWVVHTGAYSPDKPAFRGEGATRTEAILAATENSDYDKDYADIPTWIDSGSTNCPLPLNQSFLRNFMYKVEEMEVHDIKCLIGYRSKS